MPLRPPYVRLITAMFAGGLTIPLAAPGVLAQCQSSLNCYPPAGNCAYPAPGPVFYPGSPGPIAIRNAFIGVIEIPVSITVGCTLLPPQGGSSVTHDFGTNASLDFSTDGGGSWTHYAVSYSGGGVRIDPPTQQPPDLHFDAEMLWLNLPAGQAFVRESPTVPSVGGIDWRDLGNGLYRFDSYFDVFTEVSLDNGQSWFPADQPLHFTTIDLSPTATRGSTWGAVKVLYR